MGKLIDAAPPAAIAALRCATIFVGDYGPDDELLIPDDGIENILQAIDAAGFKIVPK